MLLRADEDALHTIADFAGGASTLKLFKALELIVEMMPQSILQTYVGVAYGKFDPSSPTFSYLLPVSVTVSLLGAGSTVFGLEAEMRNAAKMLGFPFASEEQARTAFAKVDAAGDGRVYTASVLSSKLECPVLSMCCLASSAFLSCTRGRGRGRGHGERGLPRWERSKSAGLRAARGARRAARGAAIPARHNRCTLG